MIVAPPETVDSTNFAKFQTGNPVVRRLIDRFYGRLRAAVEPLRCATALDAGCGEGETIARLRDVLPGTVSAIDIREDSVEFTRRRLPSVDVSRASLYELPFADNRFELVLCLEVLEHLERPTQALRELARVASGDVIVSVPFEPYFRLGSLARGKYVRHAGNHPEHLNHWNRSTLGEFLRTELEVAEVSVSFPWLIARCRAA